LFKARSIIELLDTLKDSGCKELVVHCAAGISRSGAVAKFANIYLGLDIPKLNNYDMHNIYVFNTLCDCAGIETQQSYYKGLEKDHD
jgi:protein tyrosine phosphatase